MSVSARIVEPWELVRNTVQYQVRKHVEHDTDAGIVRGWLEESDVSVLEIRRKFVGLLAFFDQAGEERSSFQYVVGGGQMAGFSRIGRAGEKYVCTGNVAEIEDYVTGTGVERQTWQINGKWKPKAGSRFEETVES